MIYVSSNIVSGKLIIHGWSKSIYLFLIHSISRIVSNFFINKLIITTINHPYQSSFPIKDVRTRITFDNWPLAKPTEHACAICNGCTLASKKRENSTSKDTFHSRHHSVLMVFKRFTIAEARILFVWESGWRFGCREPDVWPRSKSRTTPRRKS